MISTVWLSFAAHKQAEQTQCHCSYKLACSTQSCQSCTALATMPVSIYFVPAADCLNNPRERMANPVQSITCFDRAICLCRHINCLGSMFRNTVSCSASLCCFTRHIVSGWCAERCHKHKTQAKTQQQHPLPPACGFCVCWNTTAGVSIVTQMLTGTHWGH